MSVKILKRGTDGKFMSLTQPKADFLRWFDKSFPAPKESEFSYKSDYAKGIESWRVMRQGAMIGYLVGCLK